MFKKFQVFLETRNLWEVFTYLFFGGLTTLVNLIVFFCAREVFHAGLVISNSLAWILSVLFAFVTNKRWVFRSRTEGVAAYLQEFGKFVFYRALSYFLDMSDAEIGELLNVVRTTVFRHRKSALAKIKQYLEGKADDEYR